MVEWNQDVFKYESPPCYIDFHHMKDWNTHWGDIGSHMDVAMLKMIPWGFPRLSIFLRVVACTPSFSPLYFIALFKCVEEKRLPLHKSC
jgi:hypothetical protein